MDGEDETVIETIEFLGWKVRRCGILTQPGVGKWRNTLDFTFKTVVGLPR
jgi:hypothetical protein